MGWMESKQKNDGVSCLVNLQLIPEERFRNQKTINFYIDPIQIMKCLGITSLLKWKTRRNQVADLSDYNPTNHTKL